MTTLDLKIIIFFGCIALFALLDYLKHKYKEDRFEFVFILALAALIAWMTELQ